MLESPENLLRVAALKSLAEFCDYCAKLDEMVGNRIVCGINNARIQSRLLQERDLTYENALDTAQAMELAAKGIADMQIKNPFNRGTASTSASAISPPKEKKKGPRRQLLSAIDVEEISMQQNANLLMLIADHVARNVI